METVLQASSNRRTQDARRAETRQRLIASTIESLLAEGVARTSTRKVAERAGVSQGALQYHFANKGLLVEAALHTTLLTSLDGLLAPPYDSPSSRERASDLLDRLWLFHGLPIFGAVFEVLALTRRDSQASRLTAATLEALVVRIEEAVVEWLPEAVDDASVSSRVRLTIAAVRGAAAIDGVAGTDEAPNWTAIRQGLVGILLGADS